MCPGWQAKPTLYTEGAEHFQATASPDSNVEDSPVEVAEHSENDNMNMVVLTPSNDDSCS